MSRAPKLISNCPYAIEGRRLLIAERHGSEVGTGLDRRAWTVPLSSKEGLSRWPMPRSIC